MIDASADRVDEILADQATLDDDPLGDDVLPVLTANEILAGSEILLSSADEEAVEFLVAARCAHLWRAAYKAPDVTAAGTAEERGNANEEQVRVAFRAEFDASMALVAPQGWSSRPEGAVVAEPNLMQRHVAVQVRDRHRVLGFDHVAIDERVTVCDIAKLPIEDATVDIAVLSLALMGSNTEAYLHEARRVLPVDGHLWIDRFVFISSADEPAPNPPRLLAAQRQ